MEVKGGGGVDGGGWIYILGGWGWVDIFYGWIGMGGDGWRYIFSGWGSVDIYYGRVGVGGGILQMGGGVWTFPWVGRVEWGWSLVLV